MERISSFGQSTVLLQNTMRNQQRQFIAQQQISSGKKANDFQSLGPQIQEALSARQARDGVNSFRDTISSVKLSVDVFDIQLTSIVDSARGLKDTVLDAISQDDASGFMPFLEQSFGLITAALNSQVNGQYLFAGARTDQPPITVNNLAELEMLPTSADAFGNDQMKKQAIVAEGVQVEFGILADEVADEIMASMKRLAELNAVSSLDGTLKDGDPLALPPIPDQREFLIAELEKIESAVQKAQSAQINNALVGNRLDSIDEQHATAQIFLEGLVSDIEDVDLAEAITRLNQDQTALAASFQVLGSLSRLSLLNFL